jgi:prevent-host-death family protein
MPITIHDARTHFSRYLAAVEKGEEFIIARGKKPIARLVPLSPVAKVPRPQVGEMMDAPVDLPPRIFAPLGEDELKDMGL